MVGRCWPGDLAQKSPRALRHNQFFGTLGRFRDLEYTAVWIAALFTIVVAAIRRNRMILMLAGLAVGWVIVEIAFAYHGWPALGRYMFEPAAIGAVLAGVGVGWVLAWLPSLRPGLPRWVGMPVVAVLVGAWYPARSRESETSTRTSATSGPAPIRSRCCRPRRPSSAAPTTCPNCGQPVTDVGYVSALAWLYHRNVGSVGGFQQGVEKAELRDPSLPKVLFRPVPRAAGRCSRCTPAPPRWRAATASTPRT